MGRLGKTLSRFLREEEGIETVEYAVMTALMVGALVFAITTLAGAMSSRFNRTALVINS